ncbi:hypothetical protein CRT38_01460 [Anaplasma phagocytophilum str. CRT38]|uniref:Uncharacterized protein n=1 Tax=Anaplasma phagocytophilum str. CRT38 TaxID=1269275 RepID=S6G6P4_ANAPH|nr:hypothetical protein CRT38_01460 [Anaplasma phagocytophilum str. CRT38]
MSGCFGYLPSKVLGAITATQIFSYIDDLKVAVLENVESGDFSGLTAWLWLSPRSLFSAFFLVIASEYQALSSYTCADLASRSLEVDVLAVSPVTALLVVVFLISTGFSAISVEFTAS